MNARRLGVCLTLLAPVLVTALLLADDKGEKSYPVVRVIDGDTIVVKMDAREVRVRLVGVDTPETVDPRKPVQYFGKEASAFTRKMLEGKRVTLEYDQQKTDRYRRTLAYVYLGEGKNRVLVNKEIIRQGYGHAYTKYPYDRKKMEEFRAAEKEARENKRGLWADRIEVKDGGKEKPKADAKATVYVTKSGTKYHAAGCRFLAKSKIETTLGEAKRRGCTACSVCKPPE